VSQSKRPPQEGERLLDRIDELLRFGAHEGPSGTGGAMSGNRTGIESAVADVNAGATVLLGGRS
jgi:hypothetical protein